MKLYVPTLAASLSGKPEKEACLYTLAKESQMQEI